MRPRNGDVQLVSIIGFMGAFLPAGTAAHSIALIPRRSPGWHRWVPIRMDVPAAIPFFSKQRLDLVTELPPAAGAGRFRPEIKTGAQQQVPLKPAPGPLHSPGWIAAHSMHREIGVRAQNGGQAVPSASRFFFATNFSITVSGPPKPDFPAEDKVRLSFPPIPGGGGMGMLSLCPVQPEPCLGLGSRSGDHCGRKGFLPDPRRPGWGGATAAGGPSIEVDGPAIACEASFSPQLPLASNFLSRWPGHAVAKIRAPPNNGLSPVNRNILIIIRGPEDADCRRCGNATRPLFSRKSRLEVHTAQGRSLPVQGHFLLNASHERTSSPFPRMPAQDFNRPSAPPRQWRPGIVDPRSCPQKYQKWSRFRHNVGIFAARKEAIGIFRFHRDYS